MQPSQLSADSFSGYPPLARAIAIQRITLIRRMPLAFAGLLMREVSGYDWLFPPERRAIDSQFAWLQSLSPAEFEGALQGFAAVNLSATVQKIDWARRPEEFLGVLTAELWSTHQIDAFRRSANEYNEAWRRAFPDRAPPLPRMAVVVLGDELRAPDYPLFRNLRSRGVLVSSVDPLNAWPSILQVVADRARQIGRASCRERV